MFAFFFQSLFSCKVFLLEDVRLPVLSIAVVNYDVFLLPATRTGPRRSNERRSAETGAEIILCYM